MKSKISILTVVLALMIASCLKNDIVWKSDDLKLRTWEIDAPIINVHIPLYETMCKEFDFDDLFVNEKGVVCIRYTRSESIGWDSNIGIQGYSNSSNPLSILFELGAVDATLSPFKVSLKPSDKTGSYVKKADLSAGEISFTLTEANNLTGYIKVTIPELTNEDGEFNKTINLPSSGENYTLEGYKIETDENHDLNVEFTISASASASGSLGIKFEISEMDVSYLSGYFGETEKTENYEIEFDFFDELNFDGNFGFREIKIDAAVTNMVGLPMDVKADVSFTNENGLNKPLEFDKDFEFHVQGATESTPYHMPTFSTTLPEIEFEHKNYPTKLKFDLEATANQKNGVSLGEVENFIARNSNNSLAEIDLTLTVPLYVKVGEFNRSDTVAFNYNKIINDFHVEEFENMTINLEIVNNLPFEVTLSVIAIDAENNPVETILLDGNIYFTKETQYIAIPMIKYQLDRFKSEDVKKIALYTIAKTPNESYVEVKDNSSLDIAVTMHFNTNVPNIF